MDKQFLIRIKFLLSNLQTDCQTFTISLRIPCRFGVELIHAPTFLLRQLMVTVDIRNVRDFETKTSQLMLSQIYDWTRIHFKIDRQIVDLAEVIKLTKVSNTTDPLCFLCFVGIWWFPPFKTLYCVKM